MKSSILLALCVASIFAKSDASSQMSSAPQLCPIDHGNLIDVKLFVASEEQCFKLCEKQEGCHYYR